MPESIFNDQDILEVSSAMIDELKRRAAASPRKRFRLCMHSSLEHRTQEMLIVFHRDSFMPPHRHPKGKSESYHIVEGAMTVYFFDNDGELIRSFDMEKAGGDKPFLYRLSSNIWHMPVPASEWVVYHETYTGPFMKERDVEFPAWAPQENDIEGVKLFLAATRTQARERCARRPSRRRRD